jgi:hypothetical protein
VTVKQWVLKTGTVAAVRDGVNRRDRSKDHAEFTAL